MTATVPAKMYQAGVHPYAATYWDPGYLPAETDLLACFKIMAQDGCAAPRRPPPPSPPSPPPARGRPCGPTC